MPNPVIICVSAPESVGVVSAVEEWRCGAKRRGNWSNPFLSLIFLLCLFPPLSIHSGTPLLAQRHETERRSGREVTPELSVR